MTRPSLARSPLALALALAAAAATVACGGKKDAPAPAPAPVQPAPAATADAGAAAAPRARAGKATDKPTPPSREQLRTYRAELQRGRKLAGAGKWGEAVTAFEKALAALPGDSRALSELGWAAFNAGDYQKALKMSTQSVLGAREPRLKAASLYNLGRVEEATGKKELAARHYRESLALRKNKTVADRLKGLGAASAPAGEAEDPLLGELFCTEPRPLDEVCACVRKQAAAWADAEPPAGADAEPPACTVGDETPAPGFRVVSAATYDMTESMLLVHEGPKGWSVVAVLDDVYNPGAFGIHEDWELVSAKATTVGGRKLVIFTTHRVHVDNDMGINEVESDDLTTQTVCVLGDGAAPTTCPLSVPVAEIFERDRLFADSELSEEDRAHIAEYGSKGLPIRDETRLRVDLGEGGTAQVVLEKGSLPEGARGLLGPHKLW